MRTFSEFVALLLFLIGAGGGIALSLTLYIQFGPIGIVAGLGAAAVSWFFSCVLSMLVAIERHLSVLIKRPML